jgi:hypothetical protein
LAVSFFTWPVCFNLATTFPTVAILSVLGGSVLPQKKMPARPVCFYLATTFS